jgi:hypothetical protein
MAGYKVSDRHIPTGPIVHDARPGEANFTASGRQMAGHDERQYN